MKEQSLIKKLNQLGESDYYPFHMPGHKRQIDLNINPYKLDITEIGGFDNLHHATGILKNLQDKWAKVYHGNHAYLLINGSSGGILSAISASTNPGDEILIARNSHKSVYHAALINRLKVHYLYPKQLEFGINSSISFEAVDKEMIQNPNIKCVVITSPTYDGVLSDIRSIAEVVHKRGGVLIIDAAHGAHLGISKEFGENEAVQYADMVILSLHKTLPSPTQSALLIYNQCMVKKELLEFYLNVYETSSPSYVMMAAMEKCLSYCTNTGENKKRFEMYEQMLEEFYQEMKKLQNLEVFDENTEESLYEKDKTKILISTRKVLNYTGEDLMEELREIYHIECEMAAVNYVIALSSFMDTREGFLRLRDALLEIDKKLVRKETMEDILETLYEKKVKQMELYEVFESEIEEIPITDSKNRISAEFCYLYPPGIPIITPGELIPEDFYQNIQIAKEKRIAVEGLSDHDCYTIKVLKKE